jgi:hypothetical protein
LASRLDTDHGRQLHLELVATAAGELLADRDRSSPILVATTLFLGWLDLGGLDLGGLDLGWLDADYHRHVRQVEQGGEA